MNSDESRFGRYSDTHSDSGNAAGHVALWKGATVTYSCKCHQEILADDVEHIRTTFTDGSSEEHGREYCANGSAVFWRSKQTESFNARYGKEAQT